MVRLYTLGKKAALFCYVQVNAATTKNCCALHNTTSPHLQFVSYAALETDMIVTSLPCIAAGLLQPLGPTSVPYSPPETITLRLNITQSSSSSSRKYLRALTWYHNGTKIFTSSDSRISLSSDNTTVTITTTSAADAGVYHAEFAGLSLYPFNELCEMETLAIPRHYPILSPVVFKVYVSGKEVL